VSAKASTILYLISMAYNDFSKDTGSWCFIYKACYSVLKPQKIKFVEVTASAVESEHAVWYSGDSEDFSCYIEYISENGK